MARAFEEGLCEAAYLDLSLVNDPAGRKESNLWKLILKARALEQEGGQSILDFLGEEAGSDLLDVTEGQLVFEWHHLGAKLDRRSPQDAVRWRTAVPTPHPLFAVVPGPVAGWERTG